MKIFVRLFPTTSCSFPVSERKAVRSNYGEEIGALLLDNGLADEITVTTVPVLIGGGEKALECGLNDGRAWIVRSNKVLVDGKMRTVYGKV